MARYCDANCKLCRREGEKLFLKGARCLSPKCALERRQYAPGQHGMSRRRKVSAYGQQLREKQKVKRMYCLLEKQFHSYYVKANAMKGVTGENLLMLFVIAPFVEEIRGARVLDLDPQPGAGELTDPLPAPAARSARGVAIGDDDDLDDRALGLREVFFSPAPGGHPAAGR